MNPVLQSTPDCSLQNEPQVSQPIFIRQKKSEPHYYSVPTTTGKAAVFNDCSQGQSVIKYCKVLPSKQTSSDQLHHLRAALRRLRVHPTDHHQEGGQGHGGSGTMILAP